MDGRSQPPAGQLFGYEQFGGRRHQIPTFQADPIKTAVCSSIIPLLFSASDLAVFKSLADDSQVFRLVLTTLAVSVL